MLNNSYCHCILAECIWNDCSWIKLWVICLVTYLDVFAHFSLGPFLGVCAVWMLPFYTTRQSHSTLPANRTLTKFHGRSSSLFSTGQPSFSEELIFAFASKSVTCICVVCGSHAKQYLACYYWKCTSLPRVLYFLRGRCRELLECCKVQVLPYIREINSFTHGLCGHILKTITSKEGRHPFRITRRKNFLWAAMGLSAWSNDV